MYLEGLITQVEVFANASGVVTDDVFIRFTFSDGDYLIARGLRRIVQPFGGSTWGMILVESNSGPESVLIREADIYKVQLQVARLKSPIGFIAEGKPAE